MELSELLGDRVLSLPDRTLGSPLTPEEQRALDAVRERMRAEDRADRSVLSAVPDRP